MTRPPRIADPSAHGAGALRLAYRLEGAPVEARVPDSVGPAAAALFPDARTPPAGGALDLVVDRDAGGGFVVRGPGGQTPAPDASAALLTFDLALAELLVRRSGRIPVHAAGVALPGGGAVALVGAGGRGKSTLAAALARAGRPLYGDDVLLLDPGGRGVRPFRRLLKLLPPAPEMLGLPAPTGPLADLWPGSALYHPDAIGSGWAEPAPLRLILFLAREPGGAAVDIAPLPRAEAVRRLLGQLQLVPRAGPEEFAALADAVHGAETATLRYGSAPDAARVLLERYR